MTEDSPTSHQLNDPVVVNGATVGLAQGPDSSPAVVVSFDLEGDTRSRDFVVHPDAISELVDLLHQGQTMARDRAEYPDVPSYALSNTEPIPPELPPELREMLVEKRRADGYCEHGLLVTRCQVCS